MRILNITQVSSGVDDIALFASLSLRLALKPRSSGRRPIGSDGRALKQNSLDLTSHALNLHILKAIITQAGRKNGGLRGGRRFVGGGTSYFCSTRRVCMVWFISHNVLAPVLCFVALSGAQTSVKWAKDDCSATIGLNPGRYARTLALLSWW